MFFKSDIYEKDNEKEILKHPVAISFSKACEHGTYGIECRERCGNCLNMDNCDNINGTCLNGCSPGYFGHLCKTRR